MPNEKNVLDQPLKLCCGNTGFTREGFCYVPSSDHGNHSVFSGDGRFSGVF
jgi:uncharacterized protein (DUF2237 family)